MGLYEPKSCCICFDTKNGSLILASLTLIGSILNILNALSGQLSASLSAVWDQINKDSPSEYQQYKENFILYAVIATLAWNGLLMTLSCLLIHGVRKDRPGLMLPFLAWSWTRITMEVLCSLFVTGLAIYTQEPLIFIGTFVLAICITIETYFVLVINAYHKQVKRSLSEDHQLLREEFDNDNFDYKVKV
ncbi:unnamed protein product [Meganyctiphanes norvegica]|uniref:Uncharacterized protein n=1 Tax=Meganyctiphanes norvegica TaxID=48144 RepID=A0AAV2REG4_MEGNR